MNRTIAEAKKIICPILSLKPSITGFVNCFADGCAAWEAAYKREEREDHSNGALMIAERGSKTDRRPHREGGPGCSGVWILDETGYCNLIEKREVSK